MQNIMGQIGGERQARIVIRNGNPPSHSQTPRLFISNNGDLNPDSGSGHPFISGNMPGQMENIIRTLMQGMPGRAS